MAHRVREGTFDERDARDIARSRQGIVLERPEDADELEDLGAFTGGRAGPSRAGLSFCQAEGALSAYRRTVELRRQGDGSWRVRQVVEGRLGLPWWSWLLGLPVWHELGRLGPAPATRRLPWWSPPQRLDRRTAGLLANLATLVAVQGFVAGLLPETLSYAANEMRLATFGQGVVFGAVQLSALPALLALVAADKRGRRGVVLWATGTAVALSELSGLAPGVWWLAGAQVGVGALVAAAGVAATVIAIEEVPKGCRSWAFGVLGMAGGFGAGIPLALLPLAGLGGGAWRWLFWLSLACLPVVIVAGHGLPESRRWQGQVAGRQPAHWAPSTRLVLVCTGAALFALFATPAGEFETQFLRHERHFSALGISLVEQLAGTLGALGVLFGGRLADTHGRRPVAAAAVAGATVTTLLAYLSHSVLLWASTVASQFFMYATGPALGVYGAELFTTSARARSAGLVAAFSAIGGVVGTVATGALAGGMGTLAPALGVMAAGPLVLVVLLVVAYPETAEAELEELSRSESQSPTREATTESRPRSEWSAPSNQKKVTGPGMAAVAASSSAGVPKASRVPDTNKQGTWSRSKWPVRSFSGRPGGWSG